jgi:hypothetical protein
MCTRSISERSRWMNTQPDVDPEEDALEQMLLLEVCLLRHFVAGLQVS